MILGIGLDTVNVQRFSSWCNYTPERLARIFSQQEISYCLSIPLKTTERFAVRFAAREALYKALCAAYPAHTVPFLTLCAATTITCHAPHKAPTCLVKKTIFSAQYHIALNKLPTIHVSMTHTQDTATAWVILEAAS